MAQELEVSQLQWELVCWWVVWQRLLLPEALVTWATLQVRHCKKLLYCSMVVLWYRL